MRVADPRWSNASCSESSMGQAGFVGRPAEAKTPSPTKVTTGLLGTRMDGRARRVAARVGGPKKRNLTAAGEGHR